MKHEFDNGKYTVIFDEKTGKMEALRYGDPWQDLCGNKMVYCMLSEVDSLKQQRAELLEALREIGGYTGEGPMNAEWREIVKTISLTANIAVAKAEQ